MTSHSHNWGPGGRTSTAAWRRLRAQVIIRDGNRCANCGANGDTTRLECDHVTNVKRGGDDSLANTQLLCVDCHRTKTAAEARAGIAARKARLQLPEEPHPGRPGRH
ncbi:HNH endonuclease signature motif containing protein [Gordonia alkanivorans]|uniref:HNH endonuclease n=1 Tax=Gordonia alkanivorans TaxID=84096 RepID=UPI001F4E2095|nr:HNH endonuclease signature motif containing protein [Gordonia alkanivorans]MDH3026827.1 HNH endonuclease signature motif containing protein [Gordonia alkanivorans]